MEDVQFMSADEKRKVLKQWEVFLKSGLAKEKFTESLYHHLIQHCSFIAHYNRGGFYATYFEDGDDTVHFLSQFDRRHAGNAGVPPSVEYGGYWWAAGDYADINNTMIDVASRYIPALVLVAESKQRKADIAQAERLLAKHGLKIERR